MELKFVLGLGGVDVVGNAGGELDLLARRVAYHCLVGDLREDFVLHLHHIDALVPDAALRGQRRQLAVGQVTVTAVAKLVAEGVAEDDGADFPVLHIHHAIAVDVDVVGILAIFIVVPADGVVVADDGLRVVDGGGEVDHDVLARLGRARGNYRQIGVAIIGAVVVGQTAGVFARQMVIEPVLERQQPLLVVHRDGVHLRDAVFHRVVVCLVPADPAAGASVAVPAAPFVHRRRAGCAYHLPRLQKWHPATAAAVAEVPGEMRGVSIVHTPSRTYIAPARQLVRQRVADAARLAALQRCLVENRGHPHTLSIVQIGGQRDVALGLRQLQRGHIGQ